MRSGCALLVSLAVCSAAGIAQSELPDADHTWVVGAKAMRQRNSQAPLQITLHSGLRIAVPPQDVHEYGTAIVRSAMMTQAKHPSVRPSLLFVLQTRGTAPVGRSDVDVTLASGTIVRVRAGDVNDDRLTFLRTTLAQERSRLAEAARPRAAPSPDRTVAIQFDTKDVEFDPWLRRFAAQVRRNWITDLNSSPAALAAAKEKQAQIVAAVSVRKDGSLMDVSIKESSAVAVLNESTLRAIQKFSPFGPLPPDYPEQSVSFTITFYFNLPLPQSK